MNYKLLLLLAVLGHGLRAQVDDNARRSFSLEEAQTYALTHNYIIRDMQFEIEKAQQTIRETAALYYPQISGSYGVTYNAIIQPIAFPAEAAGFILGRPAPEGQEFVYANLGGGKWQSTTGLNANWYIGDVSNFLAKKATEVLKEMRRLDKEESELNVNAEVAKAYYNVLLARENMAVLSDNLESLKKNQYEIDQLYENGFLEEQDADQIALVVSTLQTNLENVRRQEVLALQFLKFQLGIPIEESIEATDPLEKFTAASEAELAALNAETLKVEDHITYRKIESQYKGAVLAYKNEKADWYPSLSFNASYSNFYVTNEFDPLNLNTYWAPSSFIGGTFQMDLFTGFARPAQIQKAKIDIYRTEIAKELTQNQLKLQLEQAKSDYLFALENYRDQQKNVEISQKIRDRTRIKYGEGLSSSLDLSQAENQFLEIQGNYIRSIQGLLYAKEDLEKALGKK